MDHECANGGRDRPDSEISGVDTNPVLVEETANQQDRANGDENVFAEKQGDVVYRRGIGPDSMPDLERQLAIVVLRGALSHRRDQWPHHLRMPTEGCEAER